MIHNVTFTGDGTTKTLSALMIASGNYSSDNANKQRLNWLQAICESGGTARVGGVNTTSSYGSPMPSTTGPSGQMLPPVHQAAFCYSPTSIFVYAPSNSIISLMWDA